MSLIDPWASIESPDLRTALKSLEDKIVTAETTGLEEEIDAIQAELAKVAIGNTEVSEVETAEIAHGLGAAPKVFVATTEQATFVGVSVTELGKEKVKLKFGAKTAKEAKVNWYARLA